MTTKKISELTVRFGLVEHRTETTPATFKPDAPVVTFRLANDARRQIQYQCSTCDGACEHAGAVFGLVLEEKTALGLAVAPAERIVAASLSDEELRKQALEERKKRSQEEKMRVKTADTRQPWTDYLVTSEVIRIPPTDEKRTLHAASMKTVASSVRKPFISEMDLLRPRQALLATGSP